MSVIDKNVIDHHFNITQWECYKLTFPFIKIIIYEMKLFAHSPVHQSDSSIINLSNLETALTPNSPMSKPTWSLKFPPINTLSLITTLLTSSQNFSVNKSSSLWAVARYCHPESIPDDNILFITLRLYVSTPSTISAGYFATVTLTPFFVESK